MSIATYPNAVSFSDLQSEFGGSNPISLSEYYAKSAGYVFLDSKGKPSGTRTAIPTTGALSINNFHGATKTNYVQLTGSGSWTVPSGVTYINLCVVAGGGGGGSGTPDGGGAGGAGGARIWTGLSVTPGASYAYTCGAGGAGSRDYHGSTGQDSSILVEGISRSVSGGGWGAGWPIVTNYDPEAGNTYDSWFEGGNGGSGGGGSGYYGPHPGGTGILYQGYQGGNSADNYSASGGGAGNYATNGYGSIAGVGISADTVVSLMDGTVSLGYVAGGGGHPGSFDSRNNDTRSGGNGGGGTGGLGQNGGYHAGDPGTAFTGGGGGGGGGGWAGSWGAGGNGGSGVIYICYYT